MCPNMKKEEWKELKEKHPILLETAKLIEEKGPLRTVTTDAGGLGWV